MKNPVILNIIIMVLIVSCQQKQSSQENSPEDVNSSEVVLVDDILQNPEDYSEKEIMVKGLVTHVCRHSGKRLHLTSPSSNKMIRVEAADGINQFQRELEGSEITVRGKFRKQVIDEDYLARWENESQTGEGVHIDHSSMEAEEKAEQIGNLRKRLEESGESEMISYWIDGNSFQVN